MAWVMFDYGGVICHPQPEQDLAALARAAGVTVAAFWDAYWVRRLDYDTGELNALTYWQDVAGRLGQSWDRDTTGELVRLDAASWLHVHPGTAALIDDLAAAGHRLALLSNAPPEVADAVAALPLIRRFEHVLFSCYLKAAKPDPDCYGQALATLGAPASEVTFIDDRPDNVAGAAQAGMRAVHFTEPAAVRIELAGMLNTS
jgi:putative hydrolase of the HAD superfamily